MKLSVLDLAGVAERWKSVKPHLEQLVTLSNGRHTLQTMAELIRRGDWRVWVIEDDAETDPAKQHRATLLTEITEFPTGMRVGGIRGCAGKGKAKWRHLLPELHAYFEAYGCSIVEVHGRIGWLADAKAAGYKQTAMIFESAIRTEKLEKFNKPNSTVVSRETFAEERTS